MARQGKSLDYQTINRIKKLRDEGRTIREIVGITKISSATIMKYLKQYENGTVNPYAMNDDKYDVLIQEIQKLKLCIETFKTSNIKYNYIPNGNNERDELKQKEDKPKELFQTSIIKQYQGKGWVTSRDLSGLLRRADGSMVTKDSIMTAWKKMKEVNNEYKEINHVYGYYVEDLIKALKIYNSIVQEKLKIVNIEDLENMMNA